MEDVKPIQLLRYGPPCKMDHAPLGTECKVPITNTEKYELYLQVGTKEDDPVWEFVGVFQNTP